MSSLTNITEKQILRGRVLKICQQAEPLGAGTEVITAALKKEGYAVTTDDIAKTCNYLVGKGLIVIEHVENVVVNISRDIAHISPAGTDVLEGTIIIDGIELI